MLNKTHHTEHKLDLLTFSGSLTKVTFSPTDALTSAYFNPVIVNGADFFSSFVVAFDFCFFAGCCTSSDEPSSQRLILRFCNPGFLAAYILYNIFGIDNIYNLIF